MKKIKRLLSLLIASILTMSLLPTPQILAEEIIWSKGWGDDREEYVMYACDICYEQMDEDEGDTVHHCSVCGDDMHYCDSCFCSTCEKCVDDCTCEMSDSVPAEYNADSLEEPTIPDVDFPKLDALVVKTDSLPMESIKEIANRIYEKKRSRSVMEMYESLCGTRDEGKCVAALRNASVFANNTALLDTNFVGSRKPTAHIRFLDALKNDSRIADELKKNFQWKSSLSVDEKIKRNDAWFDLLKKIAIESGYPAELVNKIALNTNAPDPEAMMQLVPVIDDPKYIAEIYSNKDFIKESKDGYEIAESIAHEFEHGLNYIRTLSIYDYNTDKLNMDPSHSAGDVRQYMSFCYFGNVDYTFAESSKHEEKILYYQSFVRYGAQLEERTANQAESLLSEQFAPKHIYSHHEVIQRFGYEIFPIAMSYINAMNYPVDGSEYLAMLGKAIPELQMIPGDLDFNQVPKVTGDLETYLKENGQFGNDLLARFEAADGVTYILPTKALYDWVAEKTHTKPFDWDGMIRDMNSRGNATLQSIYIDEIKPVARSSEKFPAGSFEILATLASLMQLEDEADLDDDEYAEYLARLDSLSEQAQEIADQLEALGFVDDLSSELEDLCDNIEDLQESLEDEMAEFEEISEELTEMIENAEDVLQELAEELDDQYAEMAADSDISLDELLSAFEDLQSEYENAVSEYQEEMNELGERLQELADQIEEDSNQLSSLVDEAEQLSQNLEDEADELEALGEDYESLADEMEAIEALLQQKQTERALGYEYTRIIQAHVTDEKGQPLSGIAVYYTCREVTGQMFLAKTNAEGDAVGIVENCRENDGYSVMAGLNGYCTKSDAGIWYEPQKVENQDFYVSIEDGEINYVLECSLALSQSKDQNAHTAEGSLRVTFRDGNYAKSSIPNRDYFEKMKGERSTEATWQQHYDFEMTQDNWRDERYDINYKTFWKSRMTKEKANYYGAYLLPLSQDGNLVRQNSGRYFAPLYRWENGGAVSALVTSDDFAKPNPEDETFVPYSSYAFSFDSVPSGRYQLIVLLPNGRCHFGEVNVEGKTCYSAQTWTSKGISVPENRRLKSFTLSPEVRSVEGELLDMISESIEPIFAICVDATGKQVWNVVTFDKKGRIELRGYATYANCGYSESSEYDDIAACCGQVYLLLPESSLRLLPVTYQYLFDVYWRLDENNQIKHHRKYKRASCSGIYALDGSQDRPLYVAFWEGSYSADGRIHYKTVNGTVNFELHLDTDYENYNNWGVGTEIKIDMANSVNETGVLKNQIYNRKKPGAGAGYTFRYTQDQTELKAITVSSVLTEASTTYLPLTQAAEPISIKDAEWDQSGLPATVTGTAWTRNLGETWPEKVTTREGTTLRFIFWHNCSKEGHKWRRNGTTTYCEYCGTHDAEEMPQIIEYVLPKDAWVDDPPKGWTVEHLPEPSSPFPFECKFAGWAETTVIDPANPPALYPAGSSYTAPLRTEPKDYTPQKLYAVFVRSTYERVTEEPKDWNGEYLFALDSVQEYQNYGTNQNSALLSSNHISELYSMNYNLAVDYYPHMQADPDKNWAMGEVIIAGNERQGYLISNWNQSLFLDVDGNRIVSSEQGCRFGIAHTRENMFEIYNMATSEYLNVGENFELYSGEKPQTDFNAYRKTSWYFCTLEEAEPVRRELVLAQAPFQNLYRVGAEYNPTGCVAALITSQGGKILSISDVSDRVSFHCDLTEEGQRLARVLFWDPIKCEAICAHYMVQAASELPTEKENVLQLGGSWKVLFVVGKHSFQHDGQKVYLLEQCKDAVTDARQLAEGNRGIGMPRPTWEFPYDIMDDELPLGTYPVKVSAHVPLLNASEPLLLAETQYNIEVIKGLNPDDPWKVKVPEPDITRDWLRDHFVDENLRQLLSDLINRTDVSGRHKLKLEGANIHSLDGIEILDGVNELWVRDNALTEVNLEDAKDLQVAVLGRQEATIQVKTDGRRSSVMLTDVVRTENLRNVRNVSVTDVSGRKMNHTYNRTSGKITIERISEKSRDAEMTIRYEYEAKYANGKTAIMTVYLTPEEITEVAEIPCEGGDICPSVRFTDCPAPDNWAHAGIDYCVEYGLMNGTSDSAFSPNGSMTRAMVVTVLYRQAGSPDVSKLKNPFKDVAPGKWYTDAIIWAQNQGVVTGVRADTFAPNNQITREQMAAILMRYTQNVEKQETSESADISAFPDCGTVSGYAVNAMSWAVAKGLINGVSSQGTSYLKPKGNATRAQVAAILMRYLK